MMSQNNADLCPNLLSYLLSLKMHCFAIFHWRGCGRFASDAKSNPAPLSLAAGCGAEADL